MVQLRVARPSVLTLDGLGSRVLLVRGTSKGSTKLRLLTLRGSRDLPVAPGMRTDASLGTDAAGAPVIVFARCARPWKITEGASGPCSLRVAGVDGRNERRLATGLPASCGPTSPRMARGALAFLGAGSCKRGVYLRRPGAATRLAVRDVPTEFPGTRMETMTHSIDFDGRLLVEDRAPQSNDGWVESGTWVTSVRLRRLGEPPATIVRFSTDLATEGEHTLRSVQLEGGRAYWLDKDGLHRSAATVGGPVTRLVDANPRWTPPSRAAWCSSRPTRGPA